MIVVTGGAGFIGSNIVRGLNRRGINDIYIVDSLKNSTKYKNLNRLNFIDYIDKEDFDTSVFLKKNKVEAIFHQGACSDTMEDDGKYMMKNNYEYSKNILNACIKNNVRLLYASSASVYGNGNGGFSENPNNEYPLNVYAFSKYQFDRYVSNVLKGEPNVQIAGLRYFNVYGPQENHKGRMASVAFHLFNQIKKGESMKIFEGSDDFKRDFIYVEDVVKVNMFLYEYKNISGVFNCGSGKAESFFKIADSLKEIFPLSEIEYIEFPDSLKGKYQKFTEADMSKLYEVGYDEKFISVKEGVKLYAKILEESSGFLV